MYRKTSKSTHFLPRKGSYSTHPHRNGRVDVLPATAIDSLYSCAAQIDDGKRLLDSLHMKRDAVAQSMHAASQLRALSDKLGSQPRYTPAAHFDKELRQLDEEIAATRRHIGSLKHLLGGGGVKTFEEAFTLVARAELAASVYDSIAVKARVVLDAARSSGGKAT